LRLELLEDRTLLTVTINGAVFNDLNQNGLRDGNEPALAGATVFLDQNHDGRVDSRDVTFTPAQNAIQADPLGLAERIGFPLPGTAPLTVAGLPAQINHVRFNLDVDYTGSATVLVVLLSPLGIQDVAGPNVFFLKHGDHFAGTFDDQAAVSADAVSSPFIGSFRPYAAFTDPNSHFYESSPNGQWDVLFESDSGDITGLTLNSWSLTFSVLDLSTQTDAAGQYSLSAPGLADGSYQLGVALPPAAGQQAPALVEQTITVSNGQASAPSDFAVHAPADLVATAFQVIGQPADWGQPVTLSFTVANQGAGDGGPFDVGVYLSSDGQIDGGDTLLQSVAFPNGLGRSSSETKLVTLDLPAKPAGFIGLDTSFLGLIIDPEDRVPETNKANNSNQGQEIDEATIAPAANTAVTSGGGVHQQPSIAVDPNDPSHLVVAYMDYTTLHDGYAGISVAVSSNAGATWQTVPFALPAGFDKAAGYPVVHFDDAKPVAHVFISFMAARFSPSLQPPLIYPRGQDPSGAEYTSYEFQSNNGIFVARSNDGGLDWQPPIAVASHVYAGQPVFAETIPDLAVDTFANLPDGRPNPNHGDLYVTWTRAYPSGQFPGDAQSTGGTDIMLAVSEDGGQTWQTRTQQQGGSTASAIQVQNNNGRVAAGNGFVDFSHVSVGPEGDLYVSLFAGGGFLVYYSANAGLTFRAPHNSSTFAEQNGIPFVLPGGFLTAFPAPTLLNNDPTRPADKMADAFRTLPVREIAADPTRPGYVYVVEAIQVTQDSDAGEIVFAVSKDFGQSWDQIFAVGPNPSNASEVDPGSLALFYNVLNDDDGGRNLALGKNNGNEVVSGQALPHLSVDTAGNISVIWYDTRRNPANNNLNNVDVFGVTSTDGGQHFSANYRVTDTSFDTKAGAFTDPTDAIGQTDFFLGDSIGLALADGMAYAVWTDTRNNKPAANQTGTGNQDIFFSRYSLLAPPAPGNDRFDPNNSIASATDLGSVLVRRVIPRLVTKQGDDDWFRVKTAANGDLQVSVIGLLPGQRLVLELLDSSGQNLLARGTDVLNAAGQVVGEQLALPSDSGQTYLIHVTGAVTGAVGGMPYSLALQALTGDLGTAVHGMQAGNLATPSTTAIYRYTAAVTGSLQVNLSAGANAVGRFNLQILSADGTSTLAVTQFMGKRGPEQQAQVNLPVSAGDVVLFSVSSFTNTNPPIDATGDFQLEFSNFDQFQATKPAMLFFPTHGDPSAIQVADLNGDGKPDLVAAGTSFNDPVSVLVNAGDGTFQGAQAYDVGPGSAPGLRSLAIASFTGDKIPDLAVTNFTAGDVSILLGNGSGTFQPQRRFNAAPQDDALIAVDLNGDKFTDLAVLQHSPNDKGATLAVLLGRGDGTFRPPEKLITTFTEGAGIVLAGDLNHDRKQDLVAFSFNSPVIDIFYGNGDGTFQPVQTVQAAENVASAKLVDLNGDGVPDIITTGTVDSIISVLINNGDGTFQAPQIFPVTPDKSGIATAIADIAIGDFGSGHEDVAAIVKPRNGTALPQLVILQELPDAHGHFAGYGAAQSIAVDPFLGPLQTADLAGSGALDLIAAVPGGVMVFYGIPPALPPNITAQTARDLGVITHQVVPTLSIVPTHEDSFFKLTVPTEAVANAGPEVIDFSGLFRFVDNGGLSMEVTNAAGNVLGSGARFQVIATQGEVLTLHVFGAGTSPGPRGVGAYTLDIDVLPQFVGVQAEALLPGQFGGPGGPTTSLVITLQGDRLDPRTAETAANYHVFSLGQDGVTAPGAVREIPLNTTSGFQSVVYNPGANVDVTTGITYPTAERQTITLLFTQPLPAGSYAIQFDPAIQAAPISDSESVLLAPAANLTGHPLVAVVDGNVAAGPTPVVHALVPASGALGSFDGFPTGTQFLTQLHDDLGRVLDSGLNQLGDAQSVTDQVLQQIAARFDPSLGTPGQRPTSMLVLWLDPVSLDLVDPANKHAVYDLKTNTVSNQQSRTFVEVGGNIEVLVLADVAGTFHLNVADVPPTARGGALVFSKTGDETFAFTNQLRDGIDGFTIQIPAEGGDTGTGTMGGGMGGKSGGSTGSTTGTTASTNAMTAALLIGITTAPIVPTNLRVEASTNAGALGESLGSIIGALSNAVGAAAGSGAGANAATVEQFFRDFTNGVGDGLNMLASEVGSSGQLLAESGLRAVQAPAQAILSALEAVGMPDISLPTVPLQEIGSEILKAIIPGVKAVGGAARKMPNGQKIQNPSTGTQTPPKQQTVPMPEDDELMPEEDEVLAAPPLDQAQEQDALLATAVLLAGLCYGSDRDRENPDDPDNDRRRSPRLKR
jgi:hypothetical protein